MAEPDFSLIDRRSLLAATAAALTAASAVPRVERADAVGFVEGSPPPINEPTNFSAATARRLAEIARRNAIRREANLPLLSIPKVLWQMKEQEELSEFERFEAVHGKAVLDEVLKAPRESNGPNWRPSWMEGVSYQTRVNKILWRRFYEARFRGP